MRGPAIRALRLCSLSLVTLTACSVSDQPVLDLVIENGHVVDGTGSPWFAADVGIVDGKIANVGDLATISRERTIDATGLIVSPGFVDIHNHSDDELLEMPLAENYILQGATTLVIGNCGQSTVPREEWPTFEKYFGHLENDGTTVNVAALMGHGDLRSYVVGEDDRAPTAEELDRMKSVLDGAMEDGAFGMSTGLAYAPGMFAKTDELIELCKVVAQYDGLYATHIRTEGSSSAWEESVLEAIETAENCGAHLQVSHQESHYPNWGDEEKIIKLLEAARARGMDVSTDLPPYVAGSTTIYQILPNWALDGGDPEVLRRVQDPVERKKIRHFVYEEKESHTTPPTALLGDGHADKIWVSGKHIAQIADERGLDHLDTVFQLIIENKGSVSIVMEQHYEDDIRKLVSHPLSMIESDGRIYKVGDGVPHPRSYGVFPITFRKYVRGETRVEEPKEVGKTILTLQEAVRKMTSFPASKLGIQDRGLIRENMWADITVFDLEGITDQATYADPHQFPRGIPYVIVNGEVAVENEELTGARPGRILRRSR